VYLYIHICFILYTYIYFILYFTCIHLYLSSLFFILIFYSRVFSLLVLLLWRQISPWGLINYISIYLNILCYFPPLIIKMIIRCTCLPIPHFTVMFCSDWVSFLLDWYFSLQMITTIWLIRRVEWQPEACRRWAGSWICRGCRTTRRSMCCRWCRGTWGYARRRSSASG